MSFLTLAAFLLCYPGKPSAPIALPIAQAKSITISPQLVKQPAQVSPLASLGEAVPGDGNSVVVHGLFERGQSNVSGHKSLFDKLTGIMKNTKNCPLLTITAYTDQKGTKAHNKELSRDRADSIAWAIVNRGVNSRRVVAVGGGKAPNKNETPDRQRMVKLTCGQKAQASL